MKHIQVTKSEKNSGKEMVSIWMNLNPVVGNDRLVLMGHGTTHKADESYEKLENVLRQENK